MKYLGEKMDKIFYKSPIGILEVALDKEYIYKIVISTHREMPVFKCNYSLSRDCINQLEEYFNGKRKSFQLPIKMTGTPFQVSVWKELLNIPYGATRTYEEIAKNIGNPKGYRAVGNANNKNKLMIVIPCHRVIGKTGKLIGYAGGLDKKEYLLDLENSQIK